MRKFSLPPLSALGRELEPAHDETFCAVAGHNQHGNPNKVYVGYWFWGRPSPFRLWEDLQDLPRRGKGRLRPTTEQARATWMASSVTQLTGG